MPKQSPGKAMGLLCFARNDAEMPLLENYRDEGYEAVLYIHYDEPKEYGALYGRYQ